MNKICDNFYSAISNTILIVFISLISFNTSFAKTSDYKAQVLKIEQLIEKNQLIAAQKLVYKLKHTFKESIQENYYSTKLSCKIFLFQQAFDHYNLANEKLCKLAKQLPPIYLSEAYAHKAYYWHYMMWPDSALVYSNKSYELYNKSRKFSAQIEPAFIYEVYAMTYLYRSDDLKTTAYSGMGLKGYQPKLFLYFDSSYFIQQHYPFKFTSDKAMFYRSNGNRWLDLVTGYKVKTKEESKNFKPVQWLAFRKANELYNKGIACLKEWHRNDLLTLTALKATNYTGVGKWKEAKYYFDRVFNKFSKQELFNRAIIAYQPLMIFLTMKIRNDILLPFHPNSNKKTIYLLEKLKSEFWKSFTKNSDLPYDPYRTSPYIDLFTLYAHQSSHSKNNKKELQSKAVSYLLTMKTYFHFLKNKQFLSEKKEPFLNVKSIQKRLNKNEGFILVQNDADLLADKKILITKDTILFFNSFTKNKLLSDSLSLKLYKEIYHEEFLTNFSEVDKKFPAINKIYISYDDATPYEILLKNKQGRNFSTLNYLGNTINFVRIYNPYTYFNKTKEIAIETIDVRKLTQNQSSKLMFMDEYFRTFQTFKKTSIKNYTGELTALLLGKGILHIYGHGEINVDEGTNSKGFQFSYIENNNLKSVKRLTGDFKAKRDLVVLNNCFSGYNELNFNEFNKTIPLKILSNGAASVISSPTVIDDFYSALFFKLFYLKIQKGTCFEDAFYQTRKYIFMQYPELKLPRNWNSLQLFQSYKLKKHQTEKSSLSTILMYVCLLIAGIFLLLKYARKIKT
ncbi:MAG: hypothetical protein RIT10_1234 [Bacteroidota bacterium]|jgi:hypothetical protein